MNYYNEHDPKAAAWLRELIACGHIPAGVVDERDIQQVKHDELTNYTQCHFFAGIGGWSLALKLAGWPDNQKVWTGSCPCQPLSCAGQGKGHADERHLWPTFHTLISECKPPVVFGEQVASKLGCEWLAGVRADLEGIGYAVGAADLAAGGIGAPHRRQRLFWGPTPQEDNANNAYGHKGTSFSDLPTTAMAAWPTPEAEEARRGFQNRNNGKKGSQKSLTTVVREVVEPWATPQANGDGGSRNTEGSKAHKGFSLGDQSRGDSGTGRKSSNAETEKPAGLNPAFSLWLMGYPAEWLSCGVQAMQSCRKSRRKSSPQ